MSNPVEPKVIAGTVAATVSGAAVVLIMNLINGEPADQVALQTVVTAVVVGVLGYVSGYLATTPLDVLTKRTAAARRRESDIPVDEAGHIDVITVLLMFVISVAVTIIILALTGGL